MPLALFDLDNTLVDRQAAYLRWAEWFAERHGLGEVGVAWLCRADDDGFARRDAVFGAARARFGLEPSVEALIADYRREYLTFYRPDDEVTDALAHLRAAGWVVGVVTNGPPTQHEKLARAGLAGLVDACCVSDEVGATKPDRRIFEAAFRRCGTGPDGPGPAWMVGDAPGPDIGGGRGVGLSTMWIHRQREWAETGYRPDAVVATVAEGVELLTGC